MTRTGRSLWPSSRNPPLVLRLLALIAASTCLQRDVVFLQLHRIDEHLILLASPPMMITSAMPGSFRSRGRTTQSAMVRRSIRSSRGVRNATV